MTKSFLLRLFGQPLPPGVLDLHNLESTWSSSPLPTLSAEGHRMSMCCVTSPEEKEGSAQSPEEVEDVSLGSPPWVGESGGIHNRGQGQNMISRRQI